MKADNLKFRCAHFDDIEVLVTFDPGNRSWNRKSFEQELNTKFSVIYIAEINNEIAGYSVIWEVADEIQLNKIAVHPKHRRKGIASELIYYIIKKAKNTNYKKILLEVNDNNLPAVELYKSLDFKTTGIRKNYYIDNDALLMEKIIK